MRMRTRMQASASTDDISGLLILRHLLSEVITATRACRLEDLAQRLETALRSVQPQPFQPMRKRRPRARSLSSPRRRA